MGEVEGGEGRRSGAGKEGCGVWGRGRARGAVWVGGKGRKEASD